MTIQSRSELEAENKQLRVDLAVEREARERLEKIRIFFKDSPTVEEMIAEAVTRETRRCDAAWSKQVEELTELLATAQQQQEDLVKQLHAATKGQEEIEHKKRMIAHLTKKRQPPLSAVKLAEAIVKAKEKHPGDYPK